MKPIFEYLDYRHYLRDYYIEKKSTSKFSYREFAKMAGFSSPVFIKLVIEGKSNLGRSSVTKLCRAMGLLKPERGFFKAIVQYNQAETIDEKMLHLEKLKNSNSKIKPSVLTDEQFEYFSKWYHAGVRELLNTMKFNGNYGDLADVLYPPVNVSDVEKSVQLLERLGLIEKDGLGGFNSTNQFVSSAGTALKSLAIKNVQRKMAFLAGDAIGSVPAEQRDISGATIGVSKEGFIKAREELARCRQRLLEISAEDRGSDRVYRVNLHLFPLSSPVPSDRLKTNREACREE